MTYLSRLFLSALLVLTTTTAPALCETLFHRHGHDEGVRVETPGDAHHHDEAEGKDGHSHSRMQDDTCCTKLLPAFYFQAFTRTQEVSAWGLSHPVSLHTDFSCPAVIDGTPLQKDIALCKSLCRGPSPSVPLYDLFDAYRI